MTGVPEGGEFPVKRHRRLNGEGGYLGICDEAVTSERAVAATAFEFRIEMVANRAIVIRRDAPYGATQAWANASVRHG